MRRLRILLGLVIIVLIAAALIYTQFTGDDESKLDGEDIVNFTQTVPISGQILAWTSGGGAPGQHDPQQPGSFIRINQQGKSETLLAAPVGTSRVHPCSERATTRDGRYFAFYAGHEEGTLYLYDPAGRLRKVDEVGGLTCSGLGTFQYADDGSSFGYIDYSASAYLDMAPKGTLVIRDTGTREERGRFESAMAFDLSAGSMAYVGLFAEDGQIAVFSQTHGAPVEVATISADTGCSFRAGDLEILDSDKLVVLLGQSCASSGSRWTLYTISITERSTTPIQNGATGGGYWGSVRINALFVVPNGNTAYFTIPNGLAKDRADFYAISLTPANEPERLIRNVVMPEFRPDLPPHAPGGNAWPVLSPDRRWLAVTSRNANDEVAVNIIDLSLGDDPVTVSFRAPNRGDSISGMGFSLDSAWLLFVAGGNDGADNTLWKVNTTSLIEETLSRAHYGRQLVVAPDGSAVALSTWELLEEPISDRILNLVQVKLNDLTTAILRTGGDITATRLANRRFIYPLQWR